jgi:hypothetical protein
VLGEFQFGCGCAALGHLWFFDLRLSVVCFVTSVAFLTGCGGSRDSMVGHLIADDCSKFSLANRNCPSQNESMQLTAVTFWFAFYFFSPGVVRGR